MNSKAGIKTANSLLKTKRIQALLSKIEDARKAKERARNAAMREAFLIKLREWKAEQGIKKEPSQEVTTEK